MGGIHDRVVSAMRKPGFYGRATGSVEVRETHVSVVCLTSDHVYKLKKPVVLPFADLGTTERRRHMCDEEVRLNRRLAPDVYLGVRGVVASNGAFRLGRPDDPDAVEHVVEMRRLDERCALPALIERGEAGEREIAALGTRIAEFHRHAAPVDLELALGVLRGSWKETRETLDGIAPARMRHGVRTADRFFRAFLSAFEPDIRARAAAGLFREGHGDLRLEHVFFEDDRVRVIDCAELEPRLRQLDVGADLAFLVMELEAIGRRDLARELVAAYRAAGGDPGPDPLVYFYAAERAWIRAKIVLLQQGLPGVHANEAERLASVARRMGWGARAPLLLAVCGPAASGKTTLARALSDMSGFPVCSSDVVRKELAGVAPTVRGGAELYTRERDHETYRELGRRAAAGVERWRGAIVDATFRRRDQRETFVEAAGAAPVYVSCKAPDSVVARWVAQRERESRRVSDATAEIATRQRREFAAFTERDVVCVVSTAEGPERAADAVEAMVDARLADVRVTT